MSTPGGSRLRIGGFALIGVGVVAGLVGFATAGPAAQTVVAEPAPATTQAAVPVAPPSATTTAEITTVSPPPPPAATAAAAPPARSAPARSGGGEARTVARPALRVLNNSTITGLAARAQQEFETAGWTVAEVGNFPFRNLPTSTVFYSRAAGEQEAAARLAGEFGLQSQPAAADLPDGPPGLVVILTNDFTGG